MLNRRSFLLASAAASALTIFHSLTINLAYALPTVGEVWMETPDTIAFQLDDEPITPGNFVTLGAPDAGAYDTWNLRLNPLTGLMAYASPIGPTKTIIRFSDLIGVTLVDRLALRVPGNYSITGGSGLTVSAVYYRNEAYRDGRNFIGSSQTLLISQRATTFLKLASPPVQGQAYTIANSGVFTSFSFTFDDKAVRAGGLKINEGGFRRDDAYKYATLLSRLPGGPNNGVVDFAGEYGINEVQIIDANGWSWGKFPTTLRRAWNQPDVGAGYNSGIDVADPSTAYAVTGISLANPARITCVGHPFVNGDKVRFHGIAGMTQIEGRGTTSLWIAYTVTVDDVDHFFIDQNTLTGFTAFSAVPIFSTALGGISNVCYKCYNTNRSATNVWGIDLGSWNAPSYGVYRLYIPGYGVSDPFHVDAASWAKTAAILHEGIYNLRLGCRVYKSAPYDRPIALADGVNSCANYYSTLPSPFSSENTQNIVPAGGTVQPSGNGAYATGSAFGPGWITNVRATGSRASTQDAADNDDIGTDHIPAYSDLSTVFLALPKNSRYTPFQVQLSTELCDPILFAGTDELPPLFHELAWYLEGFRTIQLANGGIVGGIGVGHFNSQTPNYPEPIQDYRGTDAGGVLAGQTVMGFWYAEDHWNDMCWAAAAANFALIAQDYGLTVLQNAYQSSAIAAYNRAQAIMSDPTVMDAHYITALDLKTKMSWTQAQYTSAMATMNVRCTIQKQRAAGALYRLLGSVAGQAIYGDYVDALYAVSASVSAGGTGYTIGDLIVLSGGTGSAAIARVATLSGSAVATATIYYQGAYSIAPTNPATQASTTGSGSGATFNLVTAVAYSLFPGTTGAYHYIVTPGAKATPRTYMLDHAYDSLSALINYYLSAQTCFNAMIIPANTSGGTLPNSPMQMVQAQMTQVVQNSVSASRATDYIKSMQAGAAFSLGNNQPGRSFTGYLGTHYNSLYMHEDSMKMGVPRPRGITAFGYFSWASGLFSFNFATAIGVNTDAATVYNADNTTGLWEGNYQKGSTKMYNPWRFTTGYWEWAPESFGLIFQSEYGLSYLVGFLTMGLYLHGWDGNTATEYSDQRFGWSRK